MEETNQIVEETQDVMTTNNENVIEEQSTNTEGTQLPKFLHPFNFLACAQRLFAEYKKHKNLVIGFDFDNTVFDTHNTGGNFSQIIDILRNCKTLGFTLCLNTAEENDEKLQWKVDYCKHFGIEPDYVNESPIMKGTKKPFFSILLDDRSGLEESFQILRIVLLNIINDPEFNKPNEK